MNEWGCRRLTGDETILLRMFADLSPARLVPVKVRGMSFMIPKIHNKIDADTSTNLNEFDRKQSECFDELSPPAFIVGNTQLQVS